WLYKKYLLFLKVKLTNICSPFIFLLILMSETGTGEVLILFKLILWLSPFALLSTYRFLEFSSEILMFLLIYVTLKGVLIKIISFKNLSNVINILILLYLICARPMYLCLSLKSISKFLIFSNDLSIMIFS